MKFTTNNDKIDKYLDELADEYKDLLLKALLYVSPSPDDLSTSELLRLDNEVKKRLVPGYMRQQRKMKVFFLMGMAYTIFGVLMGASYVFIVNGSFSSIDAIILASVVVAITGLAMSFYASLMIPLLIGGRVGESAKSYDKALIEYEIIKKWQEIEWIEDVLNPEGKNIVPGSLIRTLRNNRVITEDEEEIIKEFRKVRNDIVHFSGDKYTTEEMRVIVQRVNVLLRKLHAAVGS